MKTGYEAFLEKSNSDLVVFLEKYSNYIDDYVSFPKFNSPFYINNGKAQSFTISCDLVTLYKEDFDTIFIDIALSNYIFVYSINYQFTADKLILFRFGRLSVDFNLEKYSSKNIMIERNKKLNQLGV